MNLRHMRLIITAASALALSGCTTFSFAPPPVQTDYKVAPSKSVCGQAAASDTLISRDYRGARVLIDNFTVAYRCASHEVANGRQIFEVPSFIALVAAAIGPTFGLSDDGRIAALGAASVYGRANSYYAPRDKVPAVDAALDAVICIKSESIGVAFFDSRLGDAEAARVAIGAAQTQISKLQTALATLEVRRVATVAELQKLAQAADSSAAARASLSAELAIIETAIGSTRTELAALESALNTLVDPKTVKAAAVTGLGIDGVSDPALVISVNEQYFEMVSSALLSVERILASRLKSIGKYDAAGLQAEIAKQLEDMRTTDAKLKPASDFAGLSAPEKNEEVKLQVAAIQPRLQNCVVRAKLG